MSTQEQRTAASIQPSLSYDTAFSLELSTKEGEKDDVMVKLVAHNRSMDLLIFEVCKELLYRCSDTKSVLHELNTDLKLMFAK